MRRALFVLCMLAANLIAAFPAIAQSDVNVETNFGIVIGVVSGNVTFYEKDGNPGALRIGAIKGNLIINKGIKPATVAALTRKIALQQNSLEGLRKSLREVIDKYTEVQDLLERDAVEDPTARKSIPLLKAGRIDELGALYDDALAADDVRKIQHYLRRADIYDLQWRRTDALRLLRLAHIEFLDSHEVTFALGNRLAFGSKVEISEAKNILATAINRWHNLKIEGNDAWQMQFASTLTLYGITLHNLGVLEERKQSLAPRLEAISIFRRTCPNVQGSLADRCWIDLAWSVRSVVVLYLQDKKSDEARKLIIETIDSISKIRNTSGLTVSSYYDLGEILSLLLLKNGEFEKADSILAALLKGLPGENDAELSVIMERTELRSLVMLSLGKQARPMGDEWEKGFADCVVILQREKSPRSIAHVIRFLGRTSFHWTEEASAPQLIQIENIVLESVRHSEGAVVVSDSDSNRAKIWLALINGFVKHDEYSKAIIYLEKIRPQYAADRNISLMMEGELALLTSLIGHHQHATEMCDLLTPRLLQRHFSQCGSDGGCEFIGASILLNCAAAVERSGDTSRARTLREVGKAHAGSDMLTLPIHLLLSPGLQIE